MVVNTWDDYLHKSIDYLKASRLLRELRPTVPGPSCAEVGAGAGFFGDNGKGGTEIAMPQRLFLVGCEVR